MNKRGISIAAFAIAGVFVATAIAFAICVYSDYNSGLKAAGAKFEKLSSRTAEASEIYPSGSKAFITLFNSAVGSPEIYESINLKINGKDVYVYPMEGQRISIRKHCPSIHSRPKILPSSFGSGEALGFAKSRGGFCSVPS